MVRVNVLLYSLSILRGDTRSYSHRPEVKFMFLSQSMTLVYVLNLSLDFLVLLTLTLSIGPMNFAYVVKSLMQLKITLHLCPTPFIVQCLICDYDVKSA